MTNDFMDGWGGGGGGMMHSVSTTLDFKQSGLMNINEVEL